MTASKALESTFRFTAQPSKKSSTENVGPADALLETQTKSRKQQIKSYQVLGDVHEFEEDLAASLPPPAEPEPETTATADPEEFPPEVWQAAKLCPDRGAAVIRAYREACNMRDQYRDQLATLSGSQRGAPPPLGPSLMEIPTVADELRASRPLRVIGKFEEQQREWNCLADELARKTQRAPVDLALNRGPEHRRRMELLNLLQKALPIDAWGLGPLMWPMSLRDQWDLTLPVGNAMNGLYTKIKGDPKAVKGSLEVVVPPPGTEAVFDATHTYTQRHPGRSLTARGRSWCNSAWLQQRARDYAQNLQKLAAHPLPAGGLTLEGAALERALGDISSAPVGLADVEAQLAAADPEAFQQYKAARVEWEGQQAAETANAAAMESAASAFIELDPSSGPKLTLSTTRLVLETQEGASAQGVILAENTGTTSLQYTWGMRPQGDILGQEEGPSSSGAEGVPQPPQRFFLPTESGMILPGHSREFRVLFHSDTPGVFNEVWLLSTAPALPTGPLRVALRGIAVRDDLGGVARKALEVDLQEKEKKRQVNTVLERILRNVGPPPRIDTLGSPEDEETANSFDAANADASPSLYYDQKIVEQLSELYSEVCREYVAALPTPEEPKKSAKNKNKTGTEPPATPPTPQFSEKWNLNVASLGQLVAELEQMGRPAATGTFTELVERLRLPAGPRRMLRHAMRALVLRMADSVEAKMVAIQTEYDAKRQEAAAALEEALAAGMDQEAAEEATGAPGADWLASRAKIGVKGVVRAVVGSLPEEMLKEKLNAGDVLEARIKEVDAAIETGEVNLEEKMWQRFDLLRQWTCLGVPNRDGIR